MRSIRPTIPMIPRSPTTLTDPLIPVCKLSGKEEHHHGGRKPKCWRKDVRGSLADGARAIDPIFGSTMAVRDRQNPDRRIANDVRNVIGKDLEVYSPIPTGPHTWDFMVSGDPCNVLVYFVP